MTQLHWINRNQSLVSTYCSQNESDADRYLLSHRCLTKDSIYLPSLYNLKETPLPQKVKKKDLNQSYQPNPDKKNLPCA